MNGRRKDGPDGRTALVSSICHPSLKICGLLVDAGADTTAAASEDLDDGSPVYGETPIGLTGRLLREKNGQLKCTLGKTKATVQQQLNSLEAIRRLLLQVGAVHVISWLWPRKASFVAGLLLLLLVKRA